MKKIIALLVFSTAFLITANAQWGRAVKIDTSSTNVPKGKFGLNKADSQLVHNDGYSFKYVVLALADTSTIDFAQATATTVTDVTKTVPGARLGDEVVIGVPNAAITATGQFWGWVSAANTVTIRYSPKATENPASGVFHVTVLKYRKWH